HSAALREPVHHPRHGPRAAAATRRAARQPLDRGDQQRRPEPIPAREPAPAAAERSAPAHLRPREEDAPRWRRADRGRAPPTYTYGHTGPEVFSPDGKVRYTQYPFSGDVSAPMVHVLDLDG